MTSGGASVLISLPKTMPKIFEQVQTSVANHQKNCVSLNKLHAEAAKHTEELSSEFGSGTKLVGEKMFEDMFISMVLHVLPLKKGTTVADRLVKFIGSYVKFINERIKNEKTTSSPQNDDDDDTTASRFVSRLLRYLLKGFEAKDKNVRYRVVQMIAEMISYLGELEEDVYKSLRTSLVDRLHDKEPTVRIQAVISLARLIQSEEKEDEDDGEQSILDALTEVLVSDQAADVRKAALTNIQISSTSLPALLSRSRDVDETVRKLVYVILSDRLQHPKQLTIDHRELLVKNGLGDREEVVRTAAGKLIGGWADALGDLSEFIKIFDFMENDVAESALLSVFETRSNVFDNLEFNDSFWQDLTPEKALLASVFVEHCVKIKDDARLESSIPVVTALAFKLQSLYNDLIQRLQREQEEGMYQDDDEDALKDPKEREIVERVFVIGQMLRISVNLDYADEIGRRKMFALVKGMISQDSLPEVLLPRCLDVLRKLSSSERDLIRMIVEVIHELRDTPDVEEDNAGTESVDGDVNSDPSTSTPRPPKPPREMSVEERERADWIDMKCLTLCIGMLERVNSTFEENSTLEGILGELIIPAVRRKDLALREKGLVSLGLCCLIARRMALSSFQLFLNQVQSSPEALKIRILHIVFDILMVHEGDLLANPDVGGDKVVEFLTHLLETEESLKVQGVLSIGLAKLSLSGMIPEGAKVLQTLVLTYFSPDTSDNQELRQCLSYFFPVYCYSSSANQRRLQEVFLATFDQLWKVYRNLDSDQDMVDPAQIGLLLVDWTDPQKAFKNTGRIVDEMIHVDLAIDIVKALFDHEMEREDKKALCQLLGKLYFPDKVDEDKLRTLKLLINNIRLRRPLRDTVSNNAFTRFDAAVSKRFATQLEGLNEEEFRKLEHLKELFEFLDDIIPDSDDEETMAAPAARRTGRKRRSDSVATSTASLSIQGDDDAAFETKPRKNGRSKAQAKKRRVSQSEEEDSVVEIEPPPRRAMPQRTVRVTQPAVVEISSDSPESDEYEIDNDQTPAPRRNIKFKANRKAKRQTTATMVDDDIDALLEDDKTLDSIMDTDSDGAAGRESDEVDDLL